MSLGKKDIINNISSKAQINKHTSKIIFNIFTGIILDESRSKTVKVSNFGSFIRRSTPKRLGRNPQTKEEFIITSRTKLYFKPSNVVKELIN